MFQRIEIQSVPDAAIADRVHILLGSRLDVRVRRHLLNRQIVRRLRPCSWRALVLRARIRLLRCRRGGTLRRRLLRGRSLRWRRSLLCRLLWRLRSLCRRRSLLAGLLWLPALLLARRRLLCGLLREPGNCRGTEKRSRYDQRPQLPEKALFHAYLPRSFARIIHPTPSVLTIIAWMADNSKEFPEVDDLCQH